MNNRDGVSCYDKGTALAKQGKYVEAITAFGLALTFPLDSLQESKIHFELAQVYDALNDGSAAIRSFNQVIHLYPKNNAADLTARAYFNRGRRLLMQDRAHPAGVADSQKSFELEPDLAKEFPLDNLKYYYKNYYNAYLKIRDFYPLRTRLNDCDYQGNVYPVLTD